MSDELDVLAANEAFYDAFRRRDLGALERLWAEDDDKLACVHPGWRPLRGRDDVLASFRAILEAAPPHILCAEASVHLFGAFAFVVCRESVSGADVAATNVFVREEDGWRMVHHHAGPVSARRSEPPPSRRKKSLLN